MKAVHQTIRDTQLASKSITSYNLFKPSDTVLVEEIALGALEPTWNGPYMIILSSPMPVKVAVIIP